MRNWRLVIQTIFVFAIVGCGNYHEDYGGSDVNNVNRNPTHGFKTLSFEAVKAIAFADGCKRCHTNGGSKGGVNLDKFEKAADHISMIKSEVISNSMPPTGSPALSDYQKVVILAWIADGAKENSNTPLPDPNSKPPPPPPPPPPGFDKVSSQILQPHCVRCHAEMANYDYVTTPANLDKILSSIESDKMPKNEKPLKANLKKMLNDWVAAGKLKGFGDVASKLFIPYCVRCHSGYKDVKNVTADIEDIRDKLITNEMPKNDDPVPDNIKQLLEDWVKAGMPD